MGRDDRGRDNCTQGDEWTLYRNLGILLRSVLTSYCVCAWEATRKTVLTVSQGQIYKSWADFCSLPDQWLTANAVPDHSHPSRPSRRGQGWWQSPTGSSPHTVHLDSLLCLVGAEPTFLSVYFITAVSKYKNRVWKIKTERRSRASATPLVREVREIIKREQPNWKLEEGSLALARRIPEPDLCTPP